MPDSYSFFSKGYDIIIEPLIKDLKSSAIEMARISPDQAVLDIGCGTGSFLRMIQRYTNQLYGIDTSPGMLKFAERKLGNKADLILGSATRMEFRDASFDLVTCSMVLHETSPDVRCGILQETKRVLKPDGRLLLIDYLVHPYDTLVGFLTRKVIVFLERVAGKEHSRNFHQFIKTGGLPVLFEKHGFMVEKRAEKFSGNFEITVLRLIK